MMLEVVKFFDLMKNVMVLNFRLLSIIWFKVCFFSLVFINFNLSCFMVFRDLRVFKKVFSE